MGQEKLLYLHNLDLDLFPVERLIEKTEWQRITGEEPAKSLFHVVVPAKNEEIVIGGLLNNIIRQQIPLESSLVVDVVLNGTTDNTEQEIERIQKEVNERRDISERMHIRYSTIEKIGKTAALNYGRHLTRSDIVINIDADVLPTSNSLAKIYALMKIFPDCVVSSVMPRKMNTVTRHKILGGMQEFYDELTRENGAIIGRFCAYKPSYFPDFPENTRSDDTWLEFYALHTYGISSVKFLGQKRGSDVASYYFAPEKFLEYLSQLVRWESSFQHLMHTYPDLWDGCHLADRVKQPKGLLNAIRMYQEKYTDIPLSDKLFMYYLVQGIRIVTRNKIIFEKLGNKSDWVSPKTDRNRR